jgi:hypothetical protein
MQKELDGLTEEANCHAITAREYLEEVECSSSRFCKSCLIKIGAG